MKWSKLIGIAMVAFTAASCGVGEEDEDGRATAVDVAELLSLAGHSRDDYQLASNLWNRELSCKGDIWLPEIYWPPLKAPRIERIVLVVWDMPAGTLRGWDLPRNKWDRSYWSAELSAKEVGFGCDERYTTSFFLLAGWPDHKLSRAVGFRRADRLAFSENISHDDSALTRYSSLLDPRRANLPAPDTATYYLQNLFTGVSFSAEVPTQAAPDYPDQELPDESAKIEVDRERLGLGAITDVAAGVVYKREGVEVTSHCLTVTDETLP
jgi:hypothetical protein